MQTILVVEDEPSLRTDLVHYLAAKGYAAHAAATATECRGALGGLDQVDAVLLDLALPDGDGHTLLAEIRQARGLSCGVIILTAFGEAEDRVRGLDGGADAYLVKRASLREIEATLVSVLRRVSAPPPAAVHDGQAAAAGWVLDTANWMLTAPGGQGIKLTGMELNFLALLAANPGQVCTRGAIAEARGRTAQSDDRNIDAMVNRLRRKIEGLSGLEAPIRVIYGSGYTFAGPLTAL
ncbi:MAG: response regulator transcription factor [Azospirillaceae bacterium]|nr:response regulator transcription factor [Azospirillaceae bacterium]